MKIRARSRLHFGALERRLEALESRMARDDMREAEQPEDDFGLRALSVLVHEGMRTGRLREESGARLQRYLSELERELGEA